MPVQSKLNSLKKKNTKTTSTAIKEVETRDPDKHYCTRCGKGYAKRQYNFINVPSALYKKNDGYITVCNECVDSIFDHYLEAYGSDKACIRRICMMFDIYWNEQVYMTLANRNEKTSKRFRSYLQKIKLNQYGGSKKTYDDTLDEEGRSSANSIAQASEAIDFARYAAEAEEEEFGDDIDISEVTSAPTITQEVINFWGNGLDPTFYPELETRFFAWYGEDIDRDEIDVAECAIVKKICLLEVTINRDSAQGKPIDKSINALNTLYGSANLKPSQRAQQDGADAQLDQTPFGVFLRMVENTEPIGEAKDEFKDADGIGRYITVWFFGHLCKMLRIKNSYCRAYEDAIAALRVEHPEFNDEDDDDMLSDIFENGGLPEDTGE